MSNEKKKNKNAVYNVRPKYGIWTEEDKVVLQVALPGVNKKDIKMKTLNKFFTLRAPRDKFQYSLDINFGIQIEPEKTKAEYDEGLLRIEFEIYKPLEHAYEVKIQ